MFAELQRDNTVPANIGSYLEMTDLGEFSLCFVCTRINIILAHRLTSIVITPNDQKLGYGTHLLKHCISIAERDGLPILLECEPELRAFYERQGFKQHGSATVYSGQPKMGESEVSFVTMLWGFNSGLPDKKDGEENGESEEEYNPKNIITKGGMVGYSFKSDEYGIFHRTHSRTHRA